MVLRTWCPSRSTAMVCSRYGSIYDRELTKDYALWLYLFGLPFSGARDFARLGQLSAAVYCDKLT